MECLKDCCRILGEEEEGAGAAGDRAEGASEPGGAVGAAGGRRRAGLCRRLPAVQAASGRQRGALRPAHLQGRLRSTQGVPLPQPGAWTPEFSPLHVRGEEGRPPGLRSVHPQPRIQLPSGSHDSLPLSRVGAARHAEEAQLQRSRLDVGGQAAAQHLHVGSVLLPGQPAGGPAI
ncbi:unnamed protein product [Tetraodon nigroviridis]|uniref:(spotted green pufferfish) hypothetical protein n=1 Tax=Tetraodon nigroviridis TaxID=99883 RepID=Q4SRW5_TETNG|nr:unnamed protein product [Tetraodon nigroviridis]